MAGARKRLSPGPNKLEKRPPARRGGSRSSKASPKKSKCEVSFPSRSWRSTHGKSDKVVVLDLDQTLIYSEGFITDDASRRYVLKSANGTIKGSIRPNLSAFLDFLDSYADEVVIWTAGNGEYAELVVDVAYEGREKPRHVLHRDHCAFDGLNYHKPVEVVADLLQCDPHNILVIDDKKYTFQENPSNGLLIPPYTGDDDDDGLGRVVDWLDKGAVRYSWSFTQLSKAGVFAQ